MIGCIYLFHPLYLNEYVDKSKSKTFEADLSMDENNTYGADFSTVSSAPPLQHNFTQIDPKSTAASGVPATKETIQNSTSNTTFASKFRN